MEGVKNFRFFRRPEWQSAAMPEGGQRLKESCISGRLEDAVRKFSLHHCIFSVFCTATEVTASKRRSALKETNIVKKTSHIRA